MTSHTWRLFLAFGLAAAVVYFLLPNDVRVGAASSAVLHHIGVVVSLGVGDAAFLSTSLPDLADAFWLATALLGLEVNRRRGDDLRALLWHRARALLDHLDKLGWPPPTPRASRWSSWPWPTPTTATRSAATCSTGAST